MFISEIRAALPPLSAKEQAEAMEMADLGMSRRRAAALLGVRAIQIPKREYAAARHRGRLRSIRGLFGPSPATIHDFMRSN